MVQGCRNKGVDKMTFDGDGPIGYSQAGLSDGLAEEGPIRQ